MCKISVSVPLWPSCCFYLFSFLSTWEDCTSARLKTNVVPVKGLCWCSNLPCQKVVLKYKYVCVSKSVHIQLGNSLQIAQKLGLWKRILCLWVILSMECCITYSKERSVIKLSRLQIWTFSMCCIRLCACNTQLCEQVSSLWASPWQLQDFVKRAFSGSRTSCFSCAVVSQRQCWWEALAVCYYCITFCNDKCVLKRTILGP